MDDIIEAIRTILETKYGTQYTYVYGKTVKPGEHNLPMLCIEPVYTTRNPDGIGTNKSFEFRLTVDITLYVTMKEYVEAAPVDDEVIQHKKDMVIQFERRNVSDRSLHTNSILGTLDSALAFDAVNALKNAADYIESVEISYNETAQQISDSWVVPAVMRIVFIQHTPGCP